MLQIRKRPRQQRSAMTWDAILVAAAELFEQHGYRGTTTNKVAERAGVSIGSLYQYFPNKNALLYALAERHLEQAGEAIAQVFAELDRREPGLEETLDLLIQAAVRLHEREPGMHRLLFDQMPRSEDLASRLRANEELIAVALAGHLSRLGCGGPHPRLRALLLVQAVEAQVHGAVLAPSQDFTIQQCAQEVKGLWWAALKGGEAG